MEDMWHCVCERRGGRGRGEGKREAVEGWDGKEREGRKGKEDGVTRKCNHPR